MAAKLKVAERGAKMVQGARWTIAHGAGSPICAAREQDDQHQREIEEKNQSPDQTCRSQHRLQGRLRQIL